MTSPPASADDSVGVAALLKFVLDQLGNDRYPFLDDGVNVTVTATRDQLLDASRLRLRVVERMNTFANGDDEFTVWLDRDDGPRP